MIASYGFRDRIFRRDVDSVERSYYQFLTIFEKKKS